MSSGLANGAKYIMPGTRSYDDHCGLSRALDIVGERWSLLVVRELLFGPKRFTDLRGGLPSVSPNVLTQRLRELESAGLVSHRGLPPPGVASVYELTARGNELEAAMILLARWGSGVPLAKKAELSNNALMLALKTMFDPRRAHKLKMLLEVHLSGETFRVEIASGRFDVASRIEPGADVSIETDAPILRRLVFGARRIADAERNGALSIRGEKSVFTQFLSLFEQPRAQVPR